MRPVSRGVPSGGNSSGGSASGGSASGPSEVLVARDVAVEPSAVADARHTVDGLLIGCDAADRVRLLVSEVVTNALRYAAAPMTLTVRMAPGTVRVEMSDCSPELPVLLGGAGLATAEHGRGLRIVEELATRWGTERSGAGKIVWFEVALGTGTETGEETSP